MEHTANHLAALNFYIDAGVDEVIGIDPVDRFAESQAPAPEKASSTPPRPARTSVAAPAPAGPRGETQAEASAKALAAAAVQPGERGVVLVDAREAAAVTTWHPVGAVSIPYDFLEPTSPGLLQKVLSSRARRVVVYGDGEDPDSGEQLAQELSGKGIRNVVYVKGGAPALRGALTATMDERK